MNHVFALIARIIIIIKSESVNFEKRYLQNDTKGFERENTNNNVFSIKYAYDGSKRKKKKS